MIWHVCFFPKRPEHWWSRTYGHVSLAGFENETWVHIDLRKKQVEIKAFYTHADMTDFLSYLLTYSTVLKFGPALSEKTRDFLSPMTCVSFIKHTLGVRSRALLPDSLFRDLVSKYDAEILNAAPSDQGNQEPETKPASS